MLLEMDSVTLMASMPSLNSSMKNHVLLWPRIRLSSWSSFIASQDRGTAPGPWLGGIWDVPGAIGWGWMEAGGSVVRCRPCRWGRAAPLSG